MIPALECKIPPLVYLLMFASAAWLLALYFPLYRLRAPEVTALGTTLVAVGLATVFAAAVHFRRLRTTISPLHPQRAQALVNSGLFRYSRNPMYLGIVLMLAGWVLALGGLTGVIVVIYLS